MESRRSSSESRTVSVKGFKPTLASREKENMPSQAPLPVAVVVADGAVEDPFMVKLDQSDPSHPKVCIFLRFPVVDLGQLTIG